MRTLIPKCPTWYGLRGLGRSPISRMTLLIPVLGSIILFSTGANDIMQLSAEMLGVEDKKVIQISRQNAFFLYFGLLFFSIATLIYNAMCPMVIKEFKTEYDYYESEYGIITRNRAKNIQDQIKRLYGVDLNYNFDLKTENQNAARALGFLDNTASESREFWLRAKSQPVADLLQTHYLLENRSSVGVRRTIYGAYGVAFFLIAVPSVTTLGKIIQVLF